MKKNLSVLYIDGMPEDKNVVAVFAMPPRIDSKKNYVEINHYSDEEMVGKGIYPLEWDLAVARWPWLSEDKRLDTLV